MGLYFRKSVRMGPFRVNFSKGGVGLSVGVKGLRVGTGPRGNYIQMGSGGLYYRAALPSRGSRSRQNQGRSPSPVQSPVPTSPRIPENTVGEFHAVESAGAEAFATSSSTDLLDEIRGKHRKIRSWPFLIPVIVAFLWWAIVTHEPLWLLTIGTVAGVIGEVVAYRWDIMRKLVVLHYDLADQPLRRYEALVESANGLSRSARQWHISAQAEVKDKKYHAGAGVSVRRKAASLGVSQPPFLASNLDPVTIKLTKSTFYLFPDRILIYSGSTVGALAYSDLQSEASITRFIEEEGVAGDAKVVDKTWKYVNKRGGPDKRFKDNRELPICAYGEVKLRSASGVNEILMFSAQGAQQPFVNALHGLQ